ncbi:MAG: SDR family NAD(P)-dependent oxidoreductase [Myxococcota bacterium]
MTKTILLTGATSGIGFEAAKALLSDGHRVLIHGRSDAKVAATLASLQGLAGTVEGHVADLSKLDEVASLAEAIRAKHDELDVVINNAGVFRTPHPRTPDGQDVRFVVNALAPLVLTEALLPLLPAGGRVINVSSAAQNTLDFDALAGRRELEAFDAYAQSKLAITAWSAWLAKSHPNGPVVVSVNPGSMLATKMVREGFGVAGKDLQVGAKILVRAALSDEFASASGKYFDNDAGDFGPPHPDAQRPAKVSAIVDALKAQASALLG